MPILKLKKGDTVKVLSGKDKGKSGKIVAVDYKRHKITVEGANQLTRHQRPKKSGQKGQKVIVPMPLFPGRVMLICPNCGKPTRIGYQKNEAGTKLRVCKKCKSTF